MTRNNTTNLAIAALGSGLLDAGCSYVTNVPGSKSQELFSFLGGKDVSINERVAFEMAYGASLAGKRSVVCIKNVGLNACYDPFVHAVLNGIHAGTVVALFDDVEVTSSPERQDSRALRDVFEGIWLEPNSIQSAYSIAYNAFSLSELANMPIVIRITNQLLRQAGAYERREKINSVLPVANKRSSFISYWTVRSQLHAENLEKAVTAIKTSYFELPKKMEHKKGVLMVGCCWDELREITEPYDLFTIEKYPLPFEEIATFVKNHTSIVVLEQGNQYATEKIAANLGKSSFQITTNTGNVPDLSENWVIWNTTEKLFKALKSVQPTYVVGDEGQFTDETTKTVQACLCMGASVGICSGLADAGINYPFAVVGDTSFLHSCYPVLLEAQHKKLAFGVIVIDNDGAQSTGGQKNVGNLYSLPKGISSKTVKYKTTSEGSFKAILLEMQKAGELTVLYVTQGK